MDGQEIELKLGLAPGDLTGPALRSWLAAHNAAAPKLKSLHSIYYDTPDFALAGAGIALRVRKTGDGFVQTVKAEGAGSGGLFQRPEWEAPVPTADLDPDHLRSTDLDCFKGEGVVARLEPVFATRIQREIIVLGGVEDGAQWELELALDHGEVSAGPLSESICEIELELRQGGRERLFALARRIMETVPARPLMASKSDRGYRLAMGKIRAPQKAKPPTLLHSMTTAEAFQAVARSCMDHLLVNEQCLLATGDGESIHQMRVALRRLRSAIKVFRPIVDSPQLAAVKDDLRWLLAHLGPARDAEVFLAEIIDPVVRRHPKDQGLAALREHWRADREAKLATAMEAVRGRRFAELVLRLGEWVEMGDWLRPRRKLEAPIAPFAMERLGKSARKLMAGARDNLGRLSPEERHEIRIQGKQVRYAGEFFASLVPRKQMKVYLAELTELQDALGQLNDIAVAGPKLSGKHMTGPKAKAAGMVAGWHHARRAGLIDAAEKAWKRWRACPLPWQED